MSAEQEGLGALRVRSGSRREVSFSPRQSLTVSGRGPERAGGKASGARPICQAGGVFIIDGRSTAAAHICSPAWVNETFFSKLLRFLVADCTRVTKLTQGSSMHAP